MNKYKIERYTAEYQEKLGAYLKKTFPSYSDAYIELCLENAIDYDDGTGTAFIIIDNCGQIVGCHMFYNTQARINGECVKTRWGHDTFIDEDKRKDCSIQFIVSINRVPAFGIGVTDANKKIQESIRTRFIEGLFTFFKPNVYTLLFGINKQKRIDKYIAPAAIKAKSALFEKADTTDSMFFKNDGFWYSDSCNVDFIRDKEYMNCRFFNNPAFQYAVYFSKSSQCYFVVRPIVFHGVPVLLLVDFRYDDQRPNLIGAILDACNCIARKNRLGGLVTLSNDTEVKSYFAQRISLKRETTLLANKFLKIDGEIKTNVTTADADVDYMYYSFK